MKLQDFVSEEEVTFEAEFPDEGSGFWVEQRYLPAEELRRLQNQAANKSLVLKGGQVRSKNEAGQGIINDGLAATITGWRGLTPVILASLVPNLKQAALEKDLKKQGLHEVPCEPDNKLYLIRQVHGFALFLQNNATEAANFQAKELEEQAKN